MAVPCPSSSCRRVSPRTPCRSDRSVAQERSDLISSTLDRGVRVVASSWPTASIGLLAEPLRACEPERVGVGPSDEIDEVGHGRLRGPREVPRSPGLHPRSLVGRDREIAELTKSVASTPLTTVTGPGGVGRRRSRSRSRRSPRRSSPTACSWSGSRRCNRLTTSAARWPPRSDCRGRGVSPSRMRSATGSLNEMSCWCSTTASTWRRPWPISSRVSRRGSLVSMFWPRVGNRCGSSTR